MFWTLSCAGSRLFEVISTMRSSKNRRRQKTGGRKGEREVWVAWRSKAPKSTQSAVSWFGALYIRNLTGLAVRDMV